MSRDDAVPFWMLLGAGLAVRLVVLVVSEGFAYDQQGFHTAEAAFTQLGLNAYEGVGKLWPYPPAYFPWLAVAEEIGAFAHTLRLPAVLADLVIAAFVASLLARRGASRATQLAAVAILVAAPNFIVQSGHHGQLDAVATAFGLGAVWVWTRPGQRHRALIAGVLLGLGGGVKTVPLLLVVALSPTARSWGERARLAAAAAATFGVIVGPFYLAAPDAVRDALSYNGVPGFGGLSLIAVKLWEWEVISRPTLLWLDEYTRPLLLAPALACAALLLHRRRVEPVAAGLVVWLVVYVFGFNFFIHYLIWGLPFALALGRLGLAAAVIWAMVPPLALVYWGDPPSWLVWPLYNLPVMALWLAAAAWLTRAARPAPARWGTATPPAGGAPGGRRSASGSAGAAHSDRPA